MEKSTCPRVNVLKRLKRRITTNEQDKDSEISHVSRLMKEERVQHTNKEFKKKLGIILHARDPQTSANTRKKILR